ncbi:hypothetical protein HAX54_002626 [Datura stramonium]|uniref:Uncharacterized protein n=1 Tax=Datura stramonium TaxID=4076 RepID=A0ABS8T464_DATST|nr:hypothetical protein [Datura stramonium]
MFDDFMGTMLAVAESKICEGAILGLVGPYVDLSGLWRFNDASRDTPLPGLASVIVFTAFQISKPDLLSYRHSFPLLATPVDPSGLGRFNDASSGFIWIGRFNDASRFLGCVSLGKRCSSSCYGIAGGVLILDGRIVSSWDRVVLLLTVLLFTFDHFLDYFVEMLRFFDPMHEVVRDYRGLLMSESCFNPRDSGCVNFSTHIRAESLVHYFFLLQGLPCHVFRLHYRDKGDGYALCGLVTSDYSIARTGLACTLDLLTVLVVSGTYMLIWLPCLLLHGSSSCWCLNEKINFFDPDCSVAWTMQEQ